MSFIGKIFDKNVTGLHKALDLYRQRTETLVSNISNAETPGYRAVDLNFSGELERAFKASQSPMLKTNSLHLDSGSQGPSHLIPDLSGATKPDGNNVDIDLQMGRLAHSTGRYTSAATLLRRKIGMIKLAIREGR